MIVSVVTPTFNAIDYLDQCIRSVQAQASERVTVEHIVIDGGSTDGSVELARSLGATVMEGKDDGAFDAAHKATVASSGELVGYLGADDLLLPGALDAVVERYEQERRPWLVGGFRWIDGNGKSLGDIAPPPRWMTGRMMASLGWCCINHMATYVTREFYDRLGGFDRSYRYAGDYDFFCKALDTAPWSAVPRTVACFRRHGGNLTMSLSPRQIEEGRQVEERYASPSARVRMVERQMLRFYLNGRNPTWALRKQLDNLRAADPKTPADSPSH